MDAVELERLVRTHQAEIYRYVRYLGAEKQSVGEDMVQETFLAAYRSASAPLAADAAREAAWLRGIARNVFLMYCRQARSAKVYADSRALESAETVWQHEFLREGDGFDYVEALRQCLKKVSGKPRELLELQYTQGKSRAEMAAQYAMSEDGIKSSLRRTRALLAVCIRRTLGVSVQQTEEP